MRPYGTNSYFWGVLGVKLTFTQVSVVEGAFSVEWTHLLLLIKTLRIIYPWRPHLHTYGAIIKVHRETHI